MTIKNIGYICKSKSNYYKIISCTVKIQWMQLFYYVKEVKNIT